MKQKLLDLLACPKCKSTLVYDKKNEQLICTVEDLAYPIRDGIPVLLESEAITAQSQTSTTRS